MLAVPFLFGMLFVGRTQEVFAADAEDYYASVTAEEGAALLGELHDLITTTHTKYTRYEDCKNPAYVKKTDPGPNGQLMEFYAHAELSSEWKSGASGTWNREHVWCQSLSGGLWGESGGGADLHHIRPTESRVNSARGNNKYGDFDGGNAVWYRDASNTQIAVAGHTSGGVFEPIDEAKGDVARIVLYVYAHYNTYANVGGTTNGSGLNSYFGTLKFTNVVSASSEEAAIALLISWNELDPVDDLETARNDAVYEIQGNRNPFIDHPEYVEMIWGSGTDPVPDAAFQSAVAAIPREGTLAERYAAIRSAIVVYNGLSAQQRETSADDVERLRAAIDAYNADVDARNGQADGTERDALGALGMGEKA